MTQWIDACATDDIDAEDLIRFDHGGATYAIYHAPGWQVLRHGGQMHP